MCNSRICGMKSKQQQEEEFDSSSHVHQSKVSEKNNNIIKEMSTYELKQNFQQVGSKTRKNKLDH